jgi:hypothetical protein
LKISGVTQYLWEHGLPAKAVGLAMRMLDVPTPSLASQLPQSFAVYGMLAQGEPAVDLQQYLPHTPAVF